MRYMFLIYTTEKAEGNYTNYGADNPPAGAIVDFFQTKAGGKPPAIDIFDARGHLVRHFAGKHPVGTSGKTAAWVTNIAGVNRFIWDYSETPITPWFGAASKRARLAGSPIDLTVTEFKIVALLVLRTGEDVAYREIYDLVHGKHFVAGYGEEGYRANVRTFIKRIRKKLRDVDPGCEHIQNYAGFGYRWIPDRAETPPV